MNATYTNLQNAMKHCRDDLKLTRNNTLAMSEEDLMKWINNLPKDLSEKEIKMVSIVKRQVKNRLSARKSRQMVKIKLKNLELENCQIKQINKQLNNNINLLKTHNNMLIKELEEKNKLILKLSNELHIYQTPHDMNLLPHVFTPALTINNNFFP